MPLCSLTKGFNVKEVDRLTSSINLEYGPAITRVLPPKLIFYDAANPVSHKVRFYIAPRAGIETEVLNSSSVLLVSWSSNFSDHDPVLCC